MDKSKKLLVLILDAFSNRYLRYANYLNKLCGENYCTTIEPLFAYEGIKTAILTGLDTYETKVWHDKAFVPQGRREFRIKLLKALTTIVDKMSPNDYLNMVLRFIFFKIFREEYGTPHLIPSQYLEYFKTYTHTHKNIPDLFQILNQKGIRSTWIEPRLTSMERIWLRKLPKCYRKYDLIVLKLNSLDRLGHKYGPSSKEVEKRVECLNSEIEKSIYMVSKEYGDMRFIIMSDHGMVPVKKTINIEMKLRTKVNVKPLKDYFYYIGSTFASFWIFSNIARGEIINMLQELKGYGRILTDEELDLLGISKELYGHIIFALNEGVVFFPNFFQRRNVPRGMHGYLDTQYDKPIFITNINKSMSILKPRSMQLRFVDVNKIILNFFEHAAT